MKLAGLFSGGKDSTFSIYFAGKTNEISCLITVFSKNQESYMFHTANIELTKLQAELMNIPLITIETKGEKEEELEDLKNAIKTAIDKYKIQGIVCGGVASRYQKERIEKICNELNLKLIAPLWNIDKEKYLYALIKEFEIIITSVSAEGFNQSWLGRKIDEKCIEDLKELNKKYGVSIVGEGGEFESLVLNCPMFKKRIAIEQAVPKMTSEFCGVYEIKKVIENNSFIF